MFVGQICVRDVDLAAAALRSSIRTVEDRRARLMKKLRVRSLAELVQLCPSGGASGPTDGSDRR